MSPLIDITNVSDTTSLQLLETSPTSTDAKNKPSKIPSGCNNATSKIKCRARRRVKRRLEVKQLPNDSLILRTSEDPYLRVPPPHPGIDLILSGIRTLNLNEKSSSSIPLKGLSKDPPFAHTTLKDADPHCDTSLHPRKEDISPNTYHQCVACSLQYKSLVDLTEHLLKHIYEGLSAAQWLSQAMSTLLPPPSASPAAQSAIEGFSLPSTSITAISKL